MNRLKQLRTEKKLTQKELAKEIGVHYRTLQNWETNETQIKPDKAQALADYFDVSVGYLLGYTDNAKVYGDEKVIEIEGDVVAYSLKKWESEYPKQVFTAFVRFLSDNSFFLSDKEIIDTFNLIQSLSTNHGDSLKTKVFQEIFSDPNSQHLDKLEKDYSFIFGNEFEKDNLQYEIDRYISEETTVQAKSEKLLGVLKSAYGERHYLDYRD